MNRIGQADPRLFSASAFSKPISRSGARPVRAFFYAAGEEGGDLMRPRFGLAVPPHATIH